MLPGTWLPSVGVGNCAGPVMFRVGAVMGWNNRLADSAVLFREAECEEEGSGMGMDGCWTGCLCVCMCGSLNLVQAHSHNTPAAGPKTQLETETGEGAVQLMVADNEETLIKDRTLMCAHIQGASERQRERTCCWTIWYFQTRGQGFNE